MLKKRAVRPAVSVALVTAACGIAATSAFAAAVTICDHETVPTASQDNAAQGYRYTTSSHTYYQTYVHNLGSGDRNICGGAGGYGEACHNNEITYNYGTSRGIVTAWSRNNSAYSVNENAHADY